MNRYLSFVLLMCCIFTPVVFGQDGNNYSDQYRQNDDSNYSRDYRDNYRNNQRYRNSSFPRNVLQSSPNPNADNNTANYFSSVMKSPRRTINLSPVQSRSGSGRSSSSTGGYDASIFTPPSLLRLYLSGQFRSTNRVEETEPEPVEIEPIQPETIEVLSPSELLFEESITLFRQKRYHLASRNLRQLLELSPGDATKATAYSLCYMAMRNYDNAAEWMMKAEDSMVDNEDLYELIQSIYAKKQEFSVHLRQLETKANTVQNINTEFLLSVMHSVNDRF